MKIIFIICLMSNGKCITSLEGVYSSLVTCKTVAARHKGDFKCKKYKESYKW